MPHHRPFCPLWKVSRDFHERGSKIKKLDSLSGLIDNLGASRLWTENEGLFEASQAIARPIDLPYPAVSNPPQDDVTATGLRKTQPPKGAAMERIGESIVEMQEMINTIVDPTPDWIPGWQIEAEHVLHLAHAARDKMDYDQLRMLDGEAKRLVEKRKAWMMVN